MIHKITKTEHYIEWLGVVLILVAYALNSLLIVSAANTIYILMNVVGSGIIFWMSWKKRDYQPATLNIIWALIGVIALVRLFV